MKKMKKHQNQKKNNKTPLKRSWYRTHNPMYVQLNPRISPLGPEFRTSLLTGLIEEQCNTIKQYNLSTLFNTQEAESVFKNWLYGKLISISITFMPNNLNTSSKPLYMSIIWNAEFPSQLSSMNNVKIVPAYRTKLMSYHVQVPALESAGNNLRMWRSVVDMQYLEFYLYLHAPGNTDTWNIRLDIKVKFKGSKILNSTKLMAEVNAKGDQQLGESVGDATEHSHESKEASV